MRVLKGCSSPDFSCLTMMSRLLIDCLTPNSCTKYFKHEKLLYLMERRMGFKIETVILLSSARFSTSSSS